MSYQGKPVSAKKNLCRPRKTCVYMKLILNFVNAYWFCLKSDKNYRHITQDLWYDLAVTGIFNLNRVLFVRCKLRPKTKLTTKRQESAMTDVSPFPIYRIQSIIVISKIQRKLIILSAWKVRRHSSNVRTVRGLLENGREVLTKRQEQTEGARSVASCALFLTWFSSDYIGVLK